jgi:uncharacterized cupin superfamily protein
MTRPDCIKHYSEIQQDDDSHYPGSTELLAVRSAFGRQFGLQRLGINYDVLKPGRRTSWPHAESTEEEFVYVISGTPDVWLDGVLHRLQAGDGVGFAPGTGVAHTFINNTDNDVHLLVVGDTRRDDNQVHYPLHPQRNAEIGSLWWADHPKQALGEHDGLPDATPQD